MNSVPRITVALAALASGATPAVLARQQSADSLAVRADSLFTAAIPGSGPGCAAVVVRDSAVVFARGLGIADLAHGSPIDTLTVFQGGSLAKQITALAVLLLAEDGTLSLDDDIRRFLPDFPDYGRVVAIRHLLQHTAGLRDQWDLLQFAGWRAGDVVTGADAWDMVTRQRALNFPPGTEYLYSNTGYDALARIVAVASGTPFPVFVRDRVFTPLGMTRSRMEADHLAIVEQKAVGYLPRYEGGWAAIQPASDVVGPTNFLTTASDLGRWLRNLLDGTVGGPSLRDRMRHALILSGDTIPYGMGLVPGRYRGHSTLSHGGAERGFLSEVFVLPDLKFAAAVLCNRWQVSLSSLVRRLADVYVGGSLAPRAAPANAPAAATVALAEPALRARVGTYQEINGTRIRSLALRNGALVWTAANWTLVPIAPDRFRMEGQPAELVFRPGGRMQLLVNGQPSGDFEQRPPFVAPASGLAAFAGHYTSPDLDVTYRITARDSVLEIRGPHGLQLTAAPTYRDAFLLSPTGAILQFTRAPDGALAGFTLSTERVRALPFDRAPQGTVPSEQK